MPFCDTKARGQIHYRLFATMLAQTAALGKIDAHNNRQFTELVEGENQGGKLMSDIPINPMYLARNGKRYRSLGCEPCTSPVESNASSIDEIVEELKTTKIAERSGRAQDKEKSFTMQKLRALGYM